MNLVCDECGDSFFQYRGRPASRCDECREARPTRRYGPEHQALRTQLLDTEIGTPCARCGKPLLPSQPIDLDHTDDGRGYRGLSHARCNRRAAAIRGNQMRAAAYRAWKNGQAAPRKEPEAAPRPVSRPKATVAEVSVPGVDLRPYIEQSRRMRWRPFFDVRVVDGRWQVLYGEGYTQRGPMHWEDYGPVIPGLTPQPACPCGHHGGYCEKGRCAGCIYCAELVITTQHSTATMAGQARSAE
jgi:hypothetical protein